MNNPLPFQNEEEIESLKNETNILKDTVNDMQTILENTGLGTRSLKMLRNIEIDNLDQNGFFYINGSKLNGVAIENGYLLNLVYTSAYKCQFYISAYADSILKYRKCVAGTWTDLKNV